MTDADWKIVETRLKTAGWSIRLKCDEFIVTLMLCQIQTYRNAITVHVNGWVRGEWFHKDSESEEGRRFFPTRSRMLHSRKYREGLKKIRKSTLKELHINPDVKIEQRWPTWASFSAMKRQFIKQNSTIEIMDASDRHTPEEELMALADIHIGGSR
jgi:hypothetical protein